MDIKKFVFPQKILLTALIIIFCQFVAFAESQPVFAYEKQLLDLAKIRIRTDDYASQLETGRLFQIYAQLQEQLAWAQSMQQLLYKTDLSTPAINHLQDLTQQIRNSYKSYIAAEILGDKVAYEKPDIIIILGATWGNLLEERLKSALPLIKRIPEIKVLLSGGGRGIHQESEEMRRFLVTEGIDENRLIEECDSLDTLGNAVFSGLTMSQQKISAKNILLVTSDFHAPRALLLFKSVLGGNPRVAAVLAPHPNAENADLDQQIDVELKNGAKSMQEILSYQKIPGTGVTRRVDDARSVLYQMAIYHDLYKNRWDLLRKYEINSEGNAAQ